MGSAAAALDAMEPLEARAALMRCCGSSRWADAMLARFPFYADTALHEAADEVWANMGEEDVREAMSHHPRIGADLAVLRAKFAATETWSKNEQAGIGSADEATLIALRDGNARYDERFGHVFLVCATGKSAAEMLALLEARIDNAAEDELRIAKEEQRKITHIRLEKLGASETS